MENTAGPLLVAKSDHKKIVKRELISIGIFFYFACIELYPFAIIFFIHGLSQVLHTNDMLTVYSDRIRLNKKCLTYRKITELQFGFCPNMLLQRNYGFYCNQNGKMKSLNVTYIEDIENLWVDILYKDSAINLNEESGDKEIIRKLLKMHLNDEDFIPVYAWVKRHAGRGSYYLDGSRYREYAMAVKEDKIHIIKLGRSYGRNPSRIFFKKERVMDRKEGKFYELINAGDTSYVMGNSHIELYNIDAEMDVAIDRRRIIHRISQSEEVDILRERLEYWATHVHLEKTLREKAEDMRKEEKRKTYLDSWF